MCISYSYEDKMHREGGREARKKKNFTWSCRWRKRHHRMPNLGIQLRPYPRKHNNNDNTIYLREPAWVLHAEVGEGRGREGGEKEGGQQRTSSCMASALRGVMVACRPDSLPSRLGTRTSGRSGPASELLGRDALGDGSSSRSASAGLSRSIGRKDQDGAHRIGWPRTALMPTSAPFLMPPFPVSQSGTKTMTCNIP